MAKATSRSGAAALDEAMMQLRDAELDGGGQRDVRKAILEFCRKHENALDRDCVDGHLTGSAVIVDRSRAQVLLLHHTKLGIWVQPGGHADGDGDLARVALREAEEETGLNHLQLVTPAIDVDIHSIPARGPDSAHIHLDVRFLVLAEAGATETTNHESTASCWVGLDDPDGRLGDGDLKRLVKRALFVAGSPGLDTLL